jgi:mono/diheme cytochrome c family protein
MRIFCTILISVVFVLSASADEQSAGVPATGQVAVQFNADAAQKLIDKGITEILFIRRFTYTANHVYTEYVNSKWMPGGGLCALNLKTGQVREIVPELTQNGVVGCFDLSFDAQKIVFDCKQGADDGYRIYEVNTDGTDLRQLTFPEKNEAELVKKYRNGYHHGTDDMEPCYLPDGGIVFATTRCQFGVLCDSPDIFTVRNLYRMNEDGSGMRPLTYSPLSEATPTVLSDGRILYMRWEYVDKAAGNAKGLWSINPDGSGVAEVYGNSISFPETMIQARAVPNEPNKILMLGASHWRNNTVGTVIMVDTTKHIRSTDAMRYITDDTAAFAHDGFHFKDKNGKWYYEKTGKDGRLFRNPYPVTADLFLVSHKPKGLVWSEPAGYDLAVLDDSGKETVLLKDPSMSLWSPYPSVPRAKPPIQNGGSTVDADLAAKGLAKCLVSDVYVGMENVKRGEVKYIRILEQLPRPWSARKYYGDDKSGMAHSAIGDGLLSVKVQHGVVPVEEDGSANFVVPAGKAIYFQALDANYCAIQTERTFVHYKAGEVRSCVGCHETPNMTPPNTAAVPKALQRQASVPMPQQTQAEAKIVFDYDRQIQPILDKHCVSCHGGKEKQKGLDLRGEPKNTYSDSYLALIKLAKTEHQLLGNRRYRDEDNASNGIEYVPPYQLGALSSPLAALVHGWKQTSLADPKINQYVSELLAAHPDLKLSGAEKLTITNWLDVNCQYHPSYWGRLHAKFKDDPNYRPVVSFEKAASRE